MSLLSENVIPGNHGKVFETNAENQEDLHKIKKRLLSLEGIQDVLISSDAMPKEITVHNSEIVKVDTVKDAIREIGFHALSKRLFDLSRVD